jgi:hypothetical protein
VKLFLFSFSALLSFPSFSSLFLSNCLSSPAIGGSFSPPPPPHLAAYGLAPGAAHAAPDSESPNINTAGTRKCHGKRSKVRDKFDEMFEMKNGK